MVPLTALPKETLPIDMSVKLLEEDPGSSSPWESATAAADALPRSAPLLEESVSPPAEALTKVTSLRTESTRVTREVLGNPKVDASLALTTETLRKVAAFRFASTRVAEEV